MNTEHDDMNLPRTEKKEPPHPSDERPSARQQVDASTPQEEPSAPRSGQSFERSQMIGDDYMLLQDLGEGTFGNVKLGKHVQSG